MKVWRRVGLRAALRDARPLVCPWAASTPPQEQKLNVRCIQKLAALLLSTPLTAEPNTERLECITVWRNQ
jgi:hypothetical protein